MHGHASSHAHDHHRGHDHAHAHGHDHGHGGHGHHHHVPTDMGAAFLIALVLNAGFVVAEAVFGWRSGSTALLADAGHNLGDVLALLAAFAAARLAKTAPTARFTYGLRSSTIWAALGNAVVLLVVTGAVAAEAVRRLFEPAPVGGATVMALAAVGIAVNGVTAALFASGRKGDLNVRGAFLHMLADAVVSAGVVVAGGLILLTGWSWIDAVTSLVVSAVIVWGTWGLLRESAGMAMAGVPAGVDLAEVRGFLERLPGVSRVHDLHVWAMSTTETALTCHLVVPAGHPGDPFLFDAAHGLSHAFGIGHATLQLEIDAACACPLEHAEAA